MTETASAIQITCFGDPAEVIERAQVPIPQPVDDEVLVRVRAASINPVDWKIAQGDYPPVGADRLPLVLGRDVAGTIEAVGTRAHYMLSHGDRVFAFIGQERGGQSAYVVVKAVELVAMPAGLDFAQAAGAGLASMTAWQGLFDHGGLATGQRVLIHGGAGGVGHLAVQMARWKGATVFATASAQDRDFVRSIGADTVIDYAAERFETIATDCDLVFDTQGGAVQRRSFDSSSRAGSWSRPWSRWRARRPRAAFGSRRATTPRPMRRSSAKWRTCWRTARSGSRSPSASRWRISPPLMTAPATRTRAARWY